MKRRPMREFINIAAPNRNNIWMKSNQAAQRPITAGVMRMNKRGPNAGNQLPEAPNFSKVVQLERQNLAHAMDANSVEYSLALPVGENVNLVALAMEVIH